MKTQNYCPKIEIKDLYEYKKELLPNELLVSWTTTMEKEVVRVPI